MKYSERKKNNKKITHTSLDIVYHSDFNSWLNFQSSQLISTAKLKTIKKNAAENILRQTSWQHKETAIVGCRSVYFTLSLRCKGHPRFIYARTRTLRNSREGNERRVFYTNPHKRLSFPLNSALSFLHHTALELKQK